MDRFRFLLLKKEPLRRLVLAAEIIGERDFCLVFFEACESLIDFCLKIETARRWGGGGERGVVRDRERPLQRLGLDVAEGAGRRSVLSWKGHQLQTVEGELAHADVLERVLAPRSLAAGERNHK